VLPPGGSPEVTAICADPHQVFELPLPVYVLPAPPFDELLTLGGGALALDGEDDDADVAGLDGEVDAGVDGGVDAGVDAGTDAGTDAADDVSGGAPAPVP
jgi:hypothetical protein